MFEPVREVPKGVTGLRATGTVIEQDVKEAVALAAAATQGSKSHGLVVFVGLDFDGYLAELVRGLKNEAAENSAPFARWALVVKDDLIEEVRQYGSFTKDSHLRVFTESARPSALEWVAG